MTALPRALPKRLPSCLRQNAELNGRGEDPKPPCARD